MILFAGLWGTLSWSRTDSLAPLLVCTLSRSGKIPFISIMEKYTTCDRISESPMALANGLNNGGLSQHHTPGSGLNNHCSSFDLDHGDHYLSPTMDVV